MLKQATACFCQKQATTCFCSKIGGRLFKQAAACFCQKQAAACLSLVVCLKKLFNSRTRISNKFISGRLFKLAAAFLN